MEATMINGTTMISPSRPRSTWYQADDVYTPTGSCCAPDTLRLNANEGKPIASALQAIRDALAEPEAALAMLSRYEAPRELEAVIAAFWNVDPRRVVVCAGANDAMDRVCSTRLVPGAKALRFEPDFEMFQRRARGTGAQLVTLPWLTEPFPLRKAVELVQRCPSMSMVYLASPNNPTGLCAPSEDVMALARACDESGCAFLFDAAYGEFASSDPSKALVDTSGAYVIRSFSKAYGLAGLRVGYAIAPNRTEARLLRAAGSPYPVSNLAQRAAIACLRDTDGLAKAVDFARAARARMSRLFTSLGASVLPSEANFLLLRFDDAAAAAMLSQRLLDAGIAIRSYPETSSLASYARLSCSVDDSGLQRLQEALLGLLL